MKSSSVLEGINLDPILTTITFDEDTSVETLRQFLSYVGNLFVDLHAKINKVTLVQPRTTLS